MDGQSVGNVSVTLQGPQERLIVQSGDSSPATYTYTATPNYDVTGDAEEEAEEHDIDEEFSWSVGCAVIVSGGGSGDSSVTVKYNADDESDNTISVTYTVSPGGSDSDSVSVVVPEWEVDTAISCPDGIMSPADGYYCVPGALVSLAIGTVEDNDLRNGSSTTYPGDTCSTAWNATSGSFQNTSSGDTVVWIAPDSAVGAVTITATVVDEAVIPTGEKGTRDDTNYTDTITIHVVGVSLDICHGGAHLGNGDDGTTKTQPSTPIADADDGAPSGDGAYLLVNWDDDDGSPTNFSLTPTPDLDQTGTVAGEDNLARIYVAMTPSGTTLPTAGTLTLTVTGEGTRVKVWRSATKGTRLSFSSNTHTWDLTAAAERSDVLDIIQNGLWLEGISASTAEKDVSLTLRYTLNGEGCEDAVAATVAMIHLGNAVYREADLIALSERCHVGAVYRFDGPVCRDNLVDTDCYGLMQMQNLSPGTDKLTNVTSLSGRDYWSCYTNTAAVPDNSTGFVLRLRILRVLYWAGNTWESNYCAYDCMDPDGTSWDGTLADVHELRCDGLVELAYEFNGVMVWGQIVGSETHYDMRIDAYLDEHNNWQWGDDPEDWDNDMYTTFLPVTQGGFADAFLAVNKPQYSGLTFRGNAWQTTFSEQRLVMPTAVCPESH
jgi:hypothetical protein